MITPEKISELGWISKDKSQGFLHKFSIQEASGKWLLAIFLNPDESGFYITEILWVDIELKYNEWENGEKAFSGFIKK